MAVNYKPVDGRYGINSGGLSGLNLTKGQWVAATVYAAGDTVQNGGFAFKCTVGGLSGAVGPSPNTLVDNAATWVRIGAVSSFNQQDAVAQIELGYQALGRDDTFGVGTFIYVKYTGAVNPGDFVIFDSHGKTAIQSPVATPGASKLSKLGISMGGGAAGTFGWLLIQGVHDQANVIGAGTVGNLLAGSATLGQATTVQTLNYVFDGTALRGAGVVGTALVEVWWPTCSGR